MTEKRPLLLVKGEMRKLVLGILGEECDGGANLECDSDGVCE